MMSNRILLVFILALLTSVVKSQTTGDFLLNVTFPQTDYNVNRNLYFHVPTDYDPMNSYKLVVGFRGGPHSNAGHFRDQLVFLADSLDAIILCPENAPHFNNNEGLVKKLFRYSVDTAMAIYNINSEYIYLTGLSYGGRHAVIVAMDTESGPIPHIRGVIPFAAGSNSHLQPDYDDVEEFPPACICIGLNDNNNFLNVSRTLHQDIQANDGTSLLNEISNVGHTVAFSTYPQEMKECLDFIEGQYSAVNVSFGLSDIGIVLSPNPVDGLLFIGGAADLQIDKMYVTDIMGKLALTAPRGTTEVSVSELSTGSYFLTIKMGNHLYTEKFIVER